VRTAVWSVGARISKDSDVKQWFDVRVIDIAANGLLFLTDIMWNVGDMLWFELFIDPIMPGIYEKIQMKVKARIVGDRGIQDSMSAYGVEFAEISEADKIRLDELIRLTNPRTKMEAGLDNINA